MTLKYQVVLTERGSQALAEAAATGEKLNITHMAVGDGNGVLPAPSPGQVSLVNEVYRAALTAFTIDPSNPQQVIADMVIPEIYGGWWVREMGVLDDAGQLIAAGNCPEFYKPLLQEGAGRTPTVRMILTVSSAENINVTLDPDAVLATREFVESQSGDILSRFSDQSGAGLVNFILKKNGAPVAGAQAIRQDDINNITVPLEYFGAKGNGAKDDTAAFRDALLYSQETGAVVTGSHARNYVIRPEGEPLTLVNQQTFKVARLRGAGRNVCSMTFIGEAEEGIHAKGKKFESGAGAAFGVEFGGFYLYGDNFKGNAVHWENIGLWARLYDLRIMQFHGMGINAVAFTDHEWNNVEVRGCEGLGIRCYEPTVLADGAYRECSMMTFSRIHVLANNGRTKQWYINGGNNFQFHHCKPSEGTVGIHFDGTTHGHDLYGTYVDGSVYQTGEHVGILTGKNARNIGVHGGRFWNVKYALDIQGGGYISTSPWSLAYDSPMGSDVYDVRVGADVMYPVNIPVASRVLDLSDGWAGGAYNSRRTSYPAALSGSNGAAVIGSGKVNCSYRRNGKFVDIDCTIEVGNDTVLPGNNLTLTLPVSYPAASGESPLNATAYDKSAGKFYQGILVLNGAGGTFYFGAAANSASNPFAFAAGDRLYVKGQYKI